MHHHLLKRIALFVLLVSLCLQVFGILSCVQAETDPLVSFGVTSSRDGQYVPVFDGINAGKRIDLIMPDQLCALDFSELQGKNYWYHIVYLDDNGNASAGYVKESNFIQLTASGLALQMASPENASQISQLLAKQGTSPLFLGERQTVQEKAASVNSSTEGNKKNYILNTNTHKFHLPGCKSVKQMKEKNKKSYYGTRMEIINQGYAPCKNCNP